MKNLKQLCLVLSVGSIAALSIVACGDDTPATSGTAGTASGGTGTAGTGTAGTGTAGTGTAGTGTAGTGTGGTGTAGTGTGGSGGAKGGAGGGGGTGGASGGAGGGGGSGGAQGGAGGGGGTGGSGGAAASPECTKACVGADSVQTICGDTVPDVIKNTCLASCAKASVANKDAVNCWNMHAGFAKAAAGAEKTTHCGHATGMSTCPAWPAP
jgi:hypothetical protein